MVAKIEIPFTLTSKSGGDGVEHDEFADLYTVKCSYLIPLITIMMVNLLAIAIAISRTIYRVKPQWSRLLGVFFSFWVLADLYPFAKSLMGRGRTPTIPFCKNPFINSSYHIRCGTLNTPSSCPGLDN